VKYNTAMIISDLTGISMEVASTVRRYQACYSWNAGGGTADCKKKSKISKDRRMIRIPNPRIAMTKFINNSHAG
jgi:hypothetical protein